MRAKRASPFWKKGSNGETTWLDLPSGEHKKSEFLAINPVGKVPALIDDGVIVHDSTIITLILSPSLMVATILLTNSALAISRSYRRWRISNAPAIRSRTVSRT
jgi:Glutathione S-transferase, N-terminal domain